jgi:hypothetical protein
VSMSFVSFLRFRRVFFASPFLINLIGTRGI